MFANMDGLVRGVSKVVKHLLHHQKVVGLNLTAVLTKEENGIKKVRLDYTTFQGRHYSHSCIRLAVKKL